ncbi:SMP-30/gluconolactonase/LRE family protein [Shinella sp.]|uniref:SMP-30/gluconolactonase/LRE family protein n=1 Tax=Shinella sp. TaxID=1870904 RepID=UPI0029BA2475|nr:SMP-30/gluconolactonase/LRE family protein [Shinella sp.]MDX3972560.1 SMP-30/gluconolactonase/LRE family protein [Shinella sp.]
MENQTLEEGMFRLVADSRSQLGESPVWSAAEQVLYFVDIRGPSINRFDPVTCKLQQFMLDEEIGCIGLCHGGGFIAGLRSGIWRLDGQGRKLAKLADNPEGTEFSRFNDGRVGPDGRLYVGTVDESRQHQAKLYRYDSGGLAPLMDGLMTSNGLAFSPDGATMYHVDSPASKVTVQDFDRSTGSIAGSRVLIDIPDDSAARPDGATMDVEGCYWLAIFGAAVVRRFSPRGDLMAEYPVPVKCPTMPAFGGVDMRTLYVTTAGSRRPAEEMAQFPHSGSLFAMRAPVAGVPEPLFDEEI